MEFSIHICEYNRSNTDCETIYRPEGSGDYLFLLFKTPPFLTRGEMIDSVHRDGAVFAPVPQKFEAGTVNAAGAVGLAAAIRYLQEKGFDYIQKKELELTQRAIEGLGALPYVHILGSKDPANHTGIVSFTI